MSLKSSDLAGLCKIQTGRPVIKDNWLGETHHLFYRTNGEESGFVIKVAKSWD